MPLTIVVVVGQIRLHCGGKVVEEIPGVPRDSLAVLCLRKTTKEIEFGFIQPLSFMAAD